MTGQRVRRRLAAIVAGDVVEYSKKMGRDEVGTLARLKLIRTDVIDPMIAQCDGRLVKSTGDGVLIEFASAVDALTHVLEVQRELAVRNSAVPDAERLVFRFGINVGDIILQDDDIFGDGVNIAARLEALAPPGAVCISGNVYDQVHQKIHANFADLGYKVLKNIAEPVRIFVVEAREESGADVDVGAKVQQMEQPVIAVLPFAHLGDDADAALFADGLSEDLATALCRIPDIVVISPDSIANYRSKSKPLRQIASELGAPYLLQGSVRGSLSHMRISAHLVDGTTGNYLWSDRYDRAVNDFFAIQDDIVKRVLVEMQVKLTAGEMARVVGQGTNNLDAWLDYTRGWSELVHWNRESSLRARNHFQAAVAIDPDWALPQMALGITLRELSVHGWISEENKVFQEGLELVEQAAEKSPDEPFIVSQVGEYYILNGKAEEGIVFCEKALELAPGDSRVLGSTAMNFIRVGRYNDSLALFERLRLVCPIPVRFNLANEGLALHLMGRYEEAAKLLRQCIDMDYALARLAALEADRGNLDSAKELIVKLRRQNARASIAEFAGRSIISDLEKARWYEALLETSGLPRRS